MRRFEHRVVDPQTAVRGDLPDGLGAVRPVDRDRPALRPVGERRRERRDADAPRAPGPRRIGCEEPLVDVEAPGRGRRLGAPDRRARPDDEVAVAVDRDPAVG